MFLRVVMILYHTGVSAMKPIFITGSTGKLGQSVVNKLTSDGYKTRCLVRDHDKAYELYGDNSNVELVSGDILNKEYLIHMMTGCSMSVNLHGTTRKSTPFFNWETNRDYTHPFYVNYQGMENILDSCEYNNISKVIRITGLATEFSNLNPISVFFNYLYSNNIYWHKQSESLIRSKDIAYTIVKPGGIKEQNFDNFLVSFDRLSPPSNIGIDNLSELLKLCITTEYYTNKTIFCKGYTAKN